VAWSLIGLQAGLDRPMLIGMANSKRRWMQFSLRGGLLLVTAICIALSMWSARAERRRRAVQAIEALGGRTGYSTSDVFPIKMLQRVLPRDYVSEVGLVDVSGARVTDATLAHVEALTDLRWLTLSNTQVTDAGLVHLQPLTGLQTLGLGEPQLTDAGLVHLQWLTGLKTLILFNTQVSDAGLAHLGALRGLQTLSLDNTEVTDAGLAHLKGLTSLQRLSLVNTHVTHAGVAQLKQTLPNCRINWP
jgi:hypothetical protein